METAVTRFFSFFSKLQGKCNLQNFRRGGARSRTTGRTLELQEARRDVETKDQVEGCERDLLAATRGSGQHQEAWYWDCSDPLTFGEDKTAKKSFWLPIFSNSQNFCTIPCASAHKHYGVILWAVYMYRKGCNENKCRQVCSYQIMSGCPQASEVKFRMQT